MKKILMSLLIIAGFKSNIFAEDWQYWSAWSLSHEISDKAEFSFLTEAYFKKIISDDYVYYENVSYTHKIGYGLSLTGQLYFEGVELKDGNWQATRSLVGGVIYSKKLFQSLLVKIQDRFFYRLNSPSDFDYHRPRIYFISDIGDFTISLSDEMRMDLSGKRKYNFYRNRLYFMISRKLSSYTKLGLGYLRQSDKISGNWKSFNGIQTMLSVKF